MREIALNAMPSGGLPVRKAALERPVTRYRKAPLNTVTRYAGSRAFVCGHDLDDPQGQRDLRDLVEPIGFCT